MRGHRGQTPCYLETCHQSDYCVVQIGLATDGVSLPLGFHMYAPNATWADDARELLDAIDAILPDRCRIVLLADFVLSLTSTAGLSLSKIRASSGSISTAFGAILRLALHCTVGRSALQRE
jgi:hypothetical protein